jgi:hypothetical protein
MHRFAALTRLTCRSSDNSTGSVPAPRHKEWHQHEGE